MKCGLKKTAGLICLLIILAGTASCSMDRKIVFVDVPGSGSLGNSGTLPSGTYTVYHCRQKVTGGYEPSDYETYETETGINVAEGATADILKKSYEGFTVKSMMCNEDYICLFYDRNTITYTFKTGTQGTFSDDETEKTVTGLYGASYLKPVGFKSDAYHFLTWKAEDGITQAPAVFGSENQTFSVVWYEASDTPEGYIRIDAGSFRMGCEAETQSKPVHNVSLTRNYLMCEHEVTQYEYAQYGISGGTVSNGDMYPVYNVNWYDAVIYCNRRSMAEGLDPCYTKGGEENPEQWGTVPTSSFQSWAIVCDFDKNGYRLPTEAEWEYAARAGETNTETEVYSGTTDIYQLKDYAWYSGNSNNQPHEVMGKLPNAWGLYDMSGNVSEWCWDKCEGGSNSYADYENGVEDPTGKDSGACRIFRGGDYTENLFTGISAHCSVSLHSVGSGDNRYPYYRSKIKGFRVVRTLTD